MQHGQLVRDQRKFCRLPIPGTKSTVSMIILPCNAINSAGMNAHFYLNVQVFASILYKQPICLF